MASDSRMKGTGPSVSQSMIELQDFLGLTTTALPARRKSGLIAGTGPDRIASLPFRPGLSSSPLLDYCDSTRVSGAPSSLLWSYQFLYEDHESLVPQVAEGIRPPPHQGNTASFSSSTQQALLALR